MGTLLFVGICFMLGILLVFISERMPETKGFNWKRESMCAAGILSVAIGAVRLLTWVH